MLPIKRRVRKESFEKIMKEGVFFHAPNFYARFLDRKDGLPSLFSFVVPAKVEKTSAGRHLAKRKMTVVVEKALPSIEPGFSCLVFAKGGALALSYQEMEKEILELFVKTKMLKRKEI